MELVHHTHFDKSYTTVCCYGTPVKKIFEGREPVLECIRVQLSMEGRNVNMYLTHRFIMLGVCSFYVRLKLLIPHMGLGNPMGVVRVCMQWCLIVVLGIKDTYLIAFFIISAIFMVVAIWALRFVEYVCQSIFVREPIWFSTSRILSCCCGVSWEAVCCPKLHAIIVGQEFNFLYTTHLLAAYFVLNYNEIY